MHHPFRSSRTHRRSFTALAPTRLALAVASALALTCGAAQARDNTVRTAHAYQIRPATINRMILPPALAPASASARASLRAAVRRAALTQQGTTLTGAGEADGQQFGDSVAISADGNTAIVGVAGTSGTTYVPGAAWIFTRSKGVWSQQGPKLTEPDKVDGKNFVGTDFGSSVAISGDGNTAFVADPDGYSSIANGTGMVWVFTRSGSTWTPADLPLVPNLGTDTGYGEFGTYMTISTDGSTAIMSGSEDSAVFWVFTRSGSTWTQQGNELDDPSWATDRDHIWSLALSTNGSTALVGTPVAGENGHPKVAGSAWVFARTGSTWAEQGPALTANNQNGSAWFGTSVALSGDGNTALIGGPEDTTGKVLTGAAWAFTRSKGVWTQAATLHAKEATTEAFGAYVGLSSDGREAVIAGGNASSLLGNVWQFRNSGGSWSQQGSPASPKNENKGVGFSSMALSSSGSTTIIGSSGENDDQGAAWIFVAGGITVNTTGDESDLSSALAQGECDVDASKPGDQCTLRAAIDLLNAAPTTAQTVNFNIPGTGVPVITPKSALPTVAAGGATLDGASQTGGWVRLDGSSVKAAGSDGFALTGGSDTVRGFVIGGFNGSGIAISRKPGGNTVQGNRIGTNDAGTAADPNGIGISVTLSPGNTIGGSAPDEGNLISGCVATINGKTAEGGIGILLNGASAQNNQIEGNDIGTKVKGVGDLPNDLIGIEILGGSNNVIGGQAATPGTAPGNVIGGGTQRATLSSGILVAGEKTNAADNQIQGNRIGIDADGKLLPEAVSGVLIAGRTTGDLVGGATATQRNVITGALVENVDVESTEASHISILGNWIGTNAKGTTALAGAKGTGGGIRAAGASDVTIGLAGSGNVVVIPGSDSFAIDTAPKSEAICGCFPGEDALRTARSSDTIAGNQVGHLPLSSADLKSPSGTLGPAGLFGIVDAGGSGDTIGPGNQIDWTSMALTLLNTDGAHVTGNTIGVGPGGSRAEPNGNGIALVGTANTVVGGGRSSDGNRVTNFGDGGIWVIGSTEADARNLKDQGMSPRRSTGVTITRNGISARAFSGTAEPPNGEVLQFVNKEDKRVGIVVSAGADGTTIGGTAQGAGNVIGFNDADGILVQPASFDSNPTGTVIEGNNIGVGGDGATPLENDQIGVSVGVSDVQIGGTAAGARNLIGYNVTGVAVGPDASRVSILSNSMWSNIDGIVESKPPVPAPAIKSARVSAGTLTVTSEIREKSGEPATVQVFSNANCKDDEGKTLLASKTVTPTGSGKDQVSVTAAGASKGAAITVTVTEGGYTSQFSSCTEAG